MQSLLLAALLTAAGTESAAPAPGPRTIAGKLTEVAPSGKQIVVEAADGAVRLTLDRNTMVFLEARLGTVRDLAPGTPVRASVGVAGTAFWIELRPKGVMPTDRAGESAPEPAKGSDAPPAAPEPGPASPSPAAEKK